MSIWDYRETEHRWLISDRWLCELGMQLPKPEPCEVCQSPVAVVKFATKPKPTIGLYEVQRNNEEFYTYLTLHSPKRCQEIARIE